MIRSISKWMRPVSKPRRIREMRKLTRAQFATRYEVPLDTLRDWEQGVSYPDSAAKMLLRVIDKDTEAVINAPARTYLPPVPGSPDSRS
jgi:DNA-binding transcriptional regulator YiaG